MGRDAGFEQRADEFGEGLAAQQRVSDSFDTLTISEAPRSELGPGWEVEEWGLRCRFQPDGDTVRVVLEDAGADKPLDFLTPLDKEPAVSDAPDESR